MSIIIGYARVSTDGQSLESQQSALTQAGAERVFSEKVSGAVTDRKQLGKAISGTERWRRSVGHSPRPACEIDP